MSESDDENMVVASACCTVTLATYYYQNYIEKVPCRDSALRGAEYVVELLNGNERRFQENFRMEKHVLFSLLDILQSKNLLRHSDGIRVEEQLAMFMRVVGHNHRNRIIQERFQNSRETVSRHFHSVLDAIVALSEDFFQPAGTKTPPEILHDPSFYPYFKDCVGAIDGTHIPALVPSSEKVPFINRLGLTTQNVLVACSFDLQFQYVLAGWEGSATDSRVLNSALTREQKLHVPEGKYYLVDAGYANTLSFIAPFRGTRYHLKEYDIIGPKNPKELFNRRHSSLRTTVERIIGILKRRFPILTIPPPYPFRIQVKLVIACCILHNHIRREKRNDMFSDSEDEEEEEEEEENREPCVDARNGAQNLSRTRERELASEFRMSIANQMWNDYDG